MSFVFVTISDCFKDILAKTQLLKITRFFSETQGQFTVIFNKSTLVHTSGIQSNLLKSSLLLTSKISDLFYRLINQMGVNNILLGLFDCSL